MAERFIAAGGRYECEELRTGHASLTAVYEVEGEDVDIVIELCPNGPQVPGKVEDLVRRSLAWLETNKPVRQGPTDAPKDEGPAAEGGKLDFSRLGQALVQSRIPRQGRSRPERTQQMKAGPAGDGYGGRAGDRARQGLRRGNGQSRRHRRPVN